MMARSHGTWTCATFATIFSACFQPASVTAIEIPFVEHHIPFSIRGIRDATVADLDADGDLDVVVISVSDSSIAWYENDGAQPPEFVEHLITTSFAGASSIIASDLDDDGDVDLLATSSPHNKVSWFENDGASPPTFAERVISSDVRSASRVFVADLDGDGDDDVLASSAGDGEILWFESDGAYPPSFSEHLIADDIRLVSFLAAGDINDDGQVDVIAGSTWSGVAWYQNDGKSPLAFVKRPITEGSSSTGSTIRGHVVDFDLDLDLDVLVARSGSNGTTSWYENDGEPLPSFTGHHVRLRMFARSIWADDVDADGDVDVLAASNAGVAWYENVDDPFTSFRTRSLFGRTLGHVDVVCLPADFDGDGDLDVLGATHSSDHLMWFENPAPYPPFPKHVIATTGVGGGVVASADIDGDGDIDLVSAANDTVAWFSNEPASLGPPVFVEHLILTDANRVESMFVADLDGDLDIDVLTVVRRPINVGSGEIAWFDNDGGSVPQFTKRVIADIRTSTQVLAGDLDGDGDVDVVSATYFPDTSEGIAWYENDGSAPPSFSRHNILTNPESRFELTLVDIDNDGDLDIVSWWPRDDQVTLFENLGGQPPLFEERLLLVNLNGRKLLHLADVNLDGSVDFLIASSTMIGYYQKGEGSSLFFHPQREVTRYAESPIAMFAADLSGDGIVDVISTSAGDDKLAWHENDGGSPQTFKDRIIATGDLGVSDVIAADFDSDGDVDVAVATYHPAVTWFENMTIGCGNGVLEKGEECDDGNREWGDSCDEFCQVRGACCDGISGQCLDRRAPDQCVGSHTSFHLGVDCIMLDLQCAAAIGACCRDDLDQAGGVRSCTNVTLAKCSCSACEWFKQESCEDVIADGRCSPDYFPIPTTSEWGLIVLTLLLAAGGKIYFGRRTSAARN